MASTNKSTTMVVTPEDSKALALAPLQTSQTELTAFAEKVRGVAQSTAQTVELMNQVGELEKVAWIKQSIIVRVACINAEGKKDKKKFTALMERTGYSKASLNNFLRAGKLLIDEKKPVKTNDLKQYIGFKRAEKTAFTLAAIEKVGSFSIVPGVVRGVYTAIKLTPEELVENESIAKRNAGKDPEDFEPLKGKSVVFHSLDDLTTAKSIAASVTDEGALTLATHLPDGTIEPDTDLTFISVTGR